MRCLWDCFITGWRFIHSHVKQSYLILFLRCSVPAVLSPRLSPICQHSFGSRCSQATVNLQHFFFLTPSTCHSQESIALSAHWEKAVKRPVRVIKLLTVKRADFACGALKKCLYIVLNGICVVNSVFRVSCLTINAAFSQHCWGPRRKAYGKYVRLGGILTSWVEYTAWYEKPKHPYKKVCPPK